MATSPLIEAIVDTSAEVSRATTAVLRYATFIRMEGTKGVVSLAGGEVEINLNGMNPLAGDPLVLLQQGYELLAIGPLTALGDTEVAVATTAPTDPNIKLWMQLP